MIYIKTTDGGRVTIITCRSIDNYFRGNVQRASHETSSGLFSSVDIIFSRVYDGRPVALVCPPTRERSRKTRKHNNIIVFTRSMAILAFERFETFLDLVTAMLPPFGNENPRRPAGKSLLLFGVRRRLLPHPPGLPSVRRTTLSEDPRRLVVAYDRM